MSAGRIKKRYMNLTSVIVFVPCLLLVSGNAVFAEPYLMLDASPAIYLSAPEESIFATEPHFTLYALVNSDSGHIDGTGDGGTDGYFYLSFAIVPKLPETDPPPSLGSFILDGIPIVVVGGDMEYGTPPIDEFRPPDEVAKHGIFKTYFLEKEFTLDPAKRTDLYNSAEPPPPGPGGPGPIVTDGDLWYQDFDVDVSGLASGYVLHIDLYTKDGDGGLEFFAPFSHDLITIPIPASVILGMLGLGVVGLKLRKFA